MHIRWVDFHTTGHPTPDPARGLKAQACFEQLFPDLCAFGVWTAERWEQAGLAPVSWSRKAPAALLGLPLEG